MIEASHINKRFGTFEVLSDISFQVPEGEIYGLIGYNGVGKTTLLKILSGIYRPDGGTVRIAGQAIYENPEIKRQCFFMTEEATFFSQSSLKQMRKFYKGYYPEWQDSTFERLVEWFGVNPSMKISQFSKGMQRQAGLILAFSTRARYLFLDEAFDGLDYTMRKQMQDMIMYYARSRKATLLVSSHNLRELEDLADYIGMLSDGKLVFNDSTKQMQEHYQTCRFLLPEEIDPFTFEKKLSAELVEKETRGYLCIIKASKEEAEQRLVQLGAKEIQIRPVHLEEFFRKERKVQNVDWKEIFQ